MPSTNSNGAAISEYEIYRDAGDGLTEVVTLVYTGVAGNYQVTGLTSGSIYRFATLAKNTEGSSPKSELTIIAAASLPSQPINIVRNNALTNETALVIEWDRVADTEIPTTGYILEQAVHYGS